MLLKKSKAQISVEYLIIIGVSFAILIPGGYFFYKYSQTSNEASIRTQITQIGTSIITNAESIYGLADGSLVTQDLRYPKNVRDVYILNNQELVIKYELSSGINEAVFFSRINISGGYQYESAPRSACSGGSLPPNCGNTAMTANIPQPGNHQLKFESKTTYVYISQLK